MHIPKTGGTAVAAYFKENWQSVCAASKLRNEKYENALHATTENAILVSQIDAPCYWLSIDNGPYGQGRMVFSLLAMFRGIKIRYATGHLPFGFCQFLESNCEYTTVLRNPLERALSQYYYVRERHPNLVNCQGCNTFEGYIDGLLSQKLHIHGVDNIQTRMISGDSFNAVISSSIVCKAKLAGCDITPFMKINQSHFEKAKNNILNHFPVIGTLDELQEYQALMYVEYRYQPYKIEVLRKTSSRSKQLEDLDPETLEKLQKMLKWDLQLWQFVKNLINQRVRNLGDKFEKAMQVVENYEERPGSFRNAWNKSDIQKGNRAKALMGQ
eukprot:TRINITY_DN1890_c0_g1_i1.p2 TRINITY_DN1890_c0_g1~~TRINITY_DN1890_c0_g1_i1.p2  ORF type:complete len:327 (-),score=34.88 TRINITY_DN1890_c0_g1_i1:1158-2138(-)